MKNLPDHPARQRAAIFIWAVIAGAFVVLLLYRLFVAPTEALWVGVFGLGSFIGIWRWIAAARRSRREQQNKV